MDFSLSDEHKMIQATARQISERFRPFVSEWERTGGVPRDANLEMRDVLRDAGFLGMSVPVEHGGAGAPYIDFVLALEEFNKFTPPLSRWVQSTGGGPVQLILGSPNERIKEKYLRPLVAGEMEAAIAMSEAEAGSAATDLQTKAEDKGDHYLVNGHKMWVGGAGDADLYDVFVRFDGIAGSRGVGGLIIEKGMRGVSFGADTGLVSQRFLTRRVLYFDNCRVPKENVIVGAGEFSRLMGAFNSERLQNTALILGCASGAFELAMKYAQDRIQFGRPIVEFQMVQDMLAEMAVSLEAAHLLLYRAATLTIDGITPALESSYCKLFASEVAPRVVDLAIQVHGALGLSRDMPLERMWRDARGLSIATGTVQIHKTRIVTELTGRRFDQRPPRHADSAR